jgi:hypothetical protein
MPIFEKGTKQKIRFETSLGLLSIEDLWDLNLTTRTTKTSLDDLYKHYNKCLRETEEESLITPVLGKGNEELKLKREIVTHIIKVKLSEKVLAEKAGENKAMKEKLLEIKARKKDEGLNNLSEEELDSMIASLDSSS